jgi:Fe-S oxidoreductase
MSEKTITQKIADANQAVTSGIDEKSIEHWATIYIMGEAHRVPADLTIMQAMEYAGYKFVRSCGCRAGFCGACATVFRLKDDYKLKMDMACQTRVEDGMYLVQIPFAPAEKAIYDVEEEKYDASVLIKYYPAIARCVSCNTCTKACPQDLQVMDYINAALRGDFKRVSDLSFDCIQCGLCAMRCPADIVHYNVAQLARRMYEKYGKPDDGNIARMAEEAASDKHDDTFEEYMKMDLKEIKKTYWEQQKSKEVY